MGRHFCTTVFSICCCLFLFPSSSAGQANPTTAKIDELIRASGENGPFNGVVLVARRGRILFHGGYGHANLTWQIPNRIDTKFRIGSITKQFTAVLAMQLVEEKKIDLQAPISKYLPDYRADTGRLVTVHHLLSHTSGLPSYTENSDYGAISRDPAEVADFVNRYCSENLLFPPGSEYRYSNSGYFLVGAILEAVTDSTFEELLQTRILGPLGMRNSGYAHHDQIIPGMAEGYYPLPEGWVREAYTDMSVPFSAGAMYSTALDLLRWDQALYSESLLSNEYRELLFTPNLDDYGYGWWVQDFLGEDTTDANNVVYHLGGIRGFFNLITRRLDDQLLVVVLTNTARMGWQDLRDLTAGIARIIDEDIPGNP